FESLDSFSLVFTSLLSLESELSLSLESESSLSLVSESSISFLVDLVSSSSSFSDSSESFTLAFLDFPFFDEDSAELQAENSDTPKITIKIITINDLNILRHTEFSVFIIIFPFQKLLVFGFVRNFVGGADHYRTVVLKLFINEIFLLGFGCF